MRDRAISSKQASSQEVVEAHLRRIEAVNPSVRAVTMVLADQALDAAKAADLALAEGGELPRLHCVPFTVKENIDLVGTPSTKGFKVLAESYPTLDAPAVERLRRCGAIPIGRTNMPSLGMRLHTDSELWGPTVNPWDASRTPGGSSGGEAAAIATGIEPSRTGERHGWLAALAGPVLRRHHAESHFGPRRTGVQHRARGSADPHTADGSRRTSGPARGRHSSRCRDPGRADVARPVVRAGAPLWPHAHTTDPGRHRCGP